MKTRLKISVIVIAVLITVALYFIPAPFSITQQLVLSTFKSSTMQEFENLDEIKLLREHYNVTRTGENFNTLQSHYAQFYFVEPDGITQPPVMNIVVIKDLIQGKIHMIGGCFPAVSEGYRLEQRQILTFLQKYDCFEDEWITQDILDKEIPPFSIVYRNHDDVIDEEIVDVVIPYGISNSKKLDVDPSIVTVVIGQNNTVRWVNQDDSPSTLYSEDPKWTTGIIEPEKSATITFNDPGVYEYHGFYHTWKTGMIVVLEDRK